MNSRLTSLILRAIVVAAVAATPAVAQRTRPPAAQPPAAGTVPSVRERAGTAAPQMIPDSQGRDSREESADGWGPELRGGSPDRRPDFAYPPTWWLGVYSYNTSTGVVVTRVVPNSPAERRGLERGDRIVAVGGYQVGYVDRSIYTLGAELQQRADRRGRVTLLLQDSRSDRLTTLDVQLSPSRTRERSFPLPGFEREATPQ